MMRAPSGDQADDVIPEVVACVAGAAHDGRVYEWRGQVHEQDAARGYQSGLEHCALRTNEGGPSLKASAPMRWRLSATTGPAQRDRVTRACGG
jgi:hypothetical protein